MQIIEKGQGAPIVFIPGLQGRWEYARPTVDALARHFRIVTFSLCDEPEARSPFDPACALDSYAAQVHAALDATHHPRAVVCGLSFGGLIALRFAAAHPERVDALVLASTPGPGTRLGRRHRFYTRFPLAAGPLFLVETPFRLRRELKAALPRPAERWAFVRTMLRTAATAPVSLPRMAARARLIGACDAAEDCARIAAPTLVITGAAELDRVVPVGASSAYARLIARAETAVLEHTGHVGSLTRPDAFACLVSRFVELYKAGRHDAA
jgi:pimeloyl-ACP methyl ester carboxylesterase